MRDIGVRSPIGADLGDLREESLVKKNQKQNIYLKIVWFTIYNLYLQSLMGTGKLSLVCHIKRIYGAMLWVTQKTEVPCQSKCGTMTTSSYSNAISAKQRTLPAMIAFPYITIEFYLTKRKNKRLQLIKPFSLRTIINSGLIDGL